jgi:uncharacterized protein YcbX
VSSRTVQAVNIAPVKSLGLSHPQRVHVGPAGILEDRRFCIVDESGKMVTQREIGKLVQVHAEYQANPERLTLRLPDGAVAEGTPELGETVATRVWGRDVVGRVVVGGWGEALSEFCGNPLRLVRAEELGGYVDEFPLSVLSQASVEELGRQPGGEAASDARRFRPTLLLDGCEPHEEDSWLGRTVRVGSALRLRVVARDPRCAITTHDPDTGERDTDTLRIILNYRPPPKVTFGAKAYFGVYAIVEQPGTVAVGDAVTPA